MNYYSKPSFSSTLFHHMKSLFECFLSQDVQLIDFDNYKVPYLLNHDYDEADYECHTDYRTDFETDQSSDSSEIPLLEVKKVYDGKRKAARKILIENGRMATGDHRLAIKKERQPTKPSKPVEKTNKIRSTVLKLDDQSNNQLFTSLSGRFKTWPNQTKEKYVDGLVRTARVYMQLKDFDRAESVLFEALDFYLDKFVQIKKAVQTLSLLDDIYDEMSRYLEQIEVNKLIINIAAPDDPQVRRSVEKVMQAYRRMNLEDKAEKFIEEYNKKLHKK